MVDIIKTIIFLALFLGPYIILFVMWFREVTGIEHRYEIKHLEQSMIETYIRVNYKFFEQDILEWCQVHNKRIIDNKIVDM